MLHSPGFLSSTDCSFELTSSSQLLFLIHGKQILYFSGPWNSQLTLNTCRTPCLTEWEQQNPCTWRPNALTPHSHNKSSWQTHTHTSLVPIKIVDRWDRSREGPSLKVFLCCCELIQLQIQYSYINIKTWMWKYEIQHLEIMGLLPIFTYF